MKRFFISILSIVLLFPIVSGSTYSGGPPLDRYIVQINPAEAVGIARAIEVSGGKITHDFPILPDWLAVEVPAQAARGVIHIPGVTSIEPDALVHAVEETPPWGVDRIDADLVHQIPNKGSTVPVAIIDTGIDYTHPDLNDNYVGGYDFVNKDNDPLDDNDHGTHVAGTVAAEDNEEGVIGVAPEASLYALKVLGADGRGYYSDIIAALDWCVANNIAVANMSIGGGFRSRALEQACKNAYNKGVLLVAAAGNENSRNVLYPAKYNSVIAVSAIANESGDRAGFSNYGSAIELAAPGVNINSTVPGGGYESWDGTSMATPHVSGTAALVIASGTTGSSAVRDRLKSTAEDLGEPGKDNYFGYGLVDAEAAVSGVTPPPPPPPPDGEVVTITKAVYNSRKTELKVEATSSDAPDAVLTLTGVPPLPGEPNIVMDYDSKRGKYKKTVSGVSEKPESITVTSDKDVSDTMLESEIGGKSARAGAKVTLRNYPNPFNPETNIEYGIHETGYVSVKIYNILGQAVRTLVNENQGAGVYTVVWNGRDKQGRELSSGIYYCRLATGEKSIILKMLFLK